MINSGEIEVALSSLSSSVHIQSRDHEAIVLDNFFTEQRCHQIIQFFKDTSIEWISVDLQENLPRKSIQNMELPLIKDVSGIFYDQRVLKGLGDLFKKKLTPAGVSFWKDAEGYKLPLHLDNEAINCAIQIYFAETYEPYLGTSFGFENQNQICMTLPLRNNFGYSLKTAHKTFHGFIGQVPKGIERWSVYARYKFL